MAAREVGSGEGDRREDRMEASTPRFQRMALPPRPWWVMDRLRRGPLIGALVLGLAAIAGVAAAYHATGQINATAEARGYREAGRRWLVADEPQRALPFLVAARRAGDESALLQRLFTAAASGLEPRGFSIPAGEARGAFSPDGAHVAIFTTGKVQIWNARTGQQERELDLRAPLADSPPSAVAFSGDGKLLALMSRDDHWLVDLTATAPLLRPLLHDRDPNGGCGEPDPSDAQSGRIAFGRDAAVMAARGPRGLEIYETSPFRLLANLPLHPTWFQLSADGTRLLARHQGGQLDLWDVAAKRALPLQRRPSELPEARWVDADFYQPGSLFAVDATFSPDGATFALLTNAEHDGWRDSIDYFVEIRSAASGELIKVLRAPPEAKLHRSLLTLARNGRVHVDPRAPFHDPSAGASCVPVRPMREDLLQRSADASLIVALHPSYGARVWDAATGAPLTPWLSHDGCTTSAVFSADGDQLLTTGNAGEAAIWDLRRDTRSLAEWERLLAQSPFPTMAAAGPSI